MKGFLLSAAMGVTAAAAFGAPPAAAEEAEADSQAPITVIGHRPEREATSPKGAAALIDTPMSVQVIPDEVFDQQGARTLTDVLRNTPGITFNAGENGFSSGLANFSLRGFDTSANVFVDGARDSGSFSRDAFNIEQVEVYKGPVSDNGRGGAGGYVNIVTKTPHAEAEHHLGASYGFDEYAADDRLRVTADLNQPLSANAAARLNVMWEDGGVPGRAIAGVSAFGFAPSFAAGLNQDTRFMAALSYVEQNATPDWGVPAAIIEGMLRYNPALDAAALRDNYYGLASDYDDTQASAALARFERMLTPNLELLAQARWSHTVRDAQYAVPFQFPAPAPGLASDVQTQRQAYWRENTSLSGLLNLRARFASGSLQHTLSTGVEFTNEESSARRFSTINSNTDINNPNPYRVVALLTPSESSDITLDTAALYLFDTVVLSPRWQITAGVRAEHYQARIGAHTSTGAPAAGDGYEVSETTWGGRIGLVYKPAENATLYASWGLAPQPPGSFLSTPDISRTGDNAFPGFSTGLNSPGARVQESVNYEIGAKWDLFDSRLSATAALFRTERRNVAISGRTGALASDPIRLLGYGEQIVEGLELGLAGDITSQWTIFAGALLMDSERRHSAALALGRCRAQPTDYGLPNTDAGRAACDPAVHGANGDQLAFTPEISATLWTTYTLPFGLTLGAGARYVGESWVGRPDDAERIIPNGAFGKLPDYWVASAMAEYAISPQASVRLNIDNLTDELYAVSTNWPAQRVLLGPPRSVLLSLRLQL